MSNGKNDYQEIEVRIKAKMFPKKPCPEGGWGIYKVDVLGEQFIEETTICGAFDKEFFPNEEYTMYGQKEYNEKYRSEQYKIFNVQNKLNTPNQVRSFMMVCTKNENVVDQLMQKYGNELIETIADGKVDHTEINGLGDKNLENLREKVMENIYMKEIIAELSQFDISVTQMKKVMMRFGSQAVKKVKENPYNLCKIRGIGFKKADVIAQKMGVAPNDPNRIREAIKYTLEENESQGHTWMRRTELLETTKELLGLGMAEINQIATEGMDEDVVVVDHTKFALRFTYEAEIYIALRIKEMQAKSIPMDYIDVDAYIKKLKEKYPTITEEQCQLFYNFVKYNVNLLVGYAGCGKSWVTNLLLQMIRGKSILLLAPTGKAAKVIEGYTGVPASTIHRAIGVYSVDDDDDEGDGKQESFHDVVVCDESSMGDVKIICKLVKALKNPNVRLLLIGDDFQIPSVGAGNVLYDMIHGGVAKVTQLTKVFRQQEGGILDVATKIRLNNKFMDNDFPVDMPVPTEGNIQKAKELASVKDADEWSKGVAENIEKMRFGNDMVIHTCSQPNMLDGVLAYYEMALAEGYTPDEIVVLTPTKMNKLGTGTLNKMIQEIVNSNPNKTKKQIVYGKDEKTAIIFRVGDRVINTKNNYNAKNAFDQEVTVYNGDMGQIKEINTESGYVLIDYGFDMIKTSIKNLNTIVHAYALTIHKSQGSGFKCVILVSDKAHKFQLNANLVYTGITRSKEKCYWLCQPDVINHAMNKNMPEIRNTFLGELLRES